LSETVFYNELLSFQFVNSHSVNRGVGFFFLYQFIEVAVLC